MPYKKKAPAKRTKKAMGGALSAVQKRLLGSVQRGAKKKGAGAITNKMVELTRKHGDHSGIGTKSKATAAKQRIGGIANPLTGKLGRINQRRPGGKLPRIMSTISGARKAKELAKKRKSPLAMSPAARAAMKKKQMEAMKRRSGRRIKQRPARGGMFSRLRRAAVGSARRVPSTGRLTAAQRRARIAAARRRAATRSSRVGRPATRRAVSPSRRVGRPATRRPLSRVRRVVGRPAARRVMRRR